MRIIIFFIQIFACCLLLATANDVCAQTAKDTIPAYDSSSVQIRKLPASSLNKYRQDEDFNYSIQVAEGNGFWDRFWFWLFSKIEKIQANKFWSKFFEILLWLICISALIYAAVRLTGMDKTGMFSGNKKNDHLDYLVEQDDIYAINFNESIQSAIDQKNYRLAIRLLYLQSLRKLADEEIITWKINKTNDVYMHELLSTQYYKKFAFLTNAYEYAWYGELPIELDLFKDIHQEFITFNNSIS